jgi:autotransporter-associated beta strand protein
VAAVTFSCSRALRSRSWAAHSAINGGAGADGGGNGGFGFGGGVFLQGDEVLSGAPVAGTFDAFLAIIADQSGSGGIGANAGHGRLVIAGGGVVDLAAANTYTGGTTIKKGILELTNPQGAGSGGIRFAASGGAELEYAAGANLANRISGFGGSDEIDFSTVAFAAGDFAFDNRGNVSIMEATGAPVASFKVNGGYTSANFHLGADSSGHLLVSYAVAPPTAEIAEAGGRSADLLGWRDSHFAMPVQERHNGVFALDSWLAHLWSAGSGAGGFGFLHDATPAARDAWADGAGWNSPIAEGSWTASSGHGPGPG